MSVIISGITIVGRTSMSAVSSVVSTYATDPSGVTVNEGQSVVYTITTTNVANGTTLYWTAYGTVVAADFTDNAMSGSFTITDNEGTITRTLTEDAFTEGPENLYMDVRTESTSGTVVASSALVVVGDTSLTPTDPVFNYNTLLLETSGVNAATNNTILDSSTNNYTVTRTGTPTQGTFGPFSQTGWSGQFEGGKYLTLPLAANSSIGALAGKVTTIECWMYCTSIIAVTAYSMALFGNYASVAQNGRFAIYLLGDSTTSAQRLTFAYTTSTGTEAVVTNTTGIQQNSWNHIALTIDATTAATSSVKLYVNGVGQTFTANLSTHTTDPGIAFLIADTTTGLQNFNGNLSNFRITRSIVYTSNFTPPTAPLTAIANTSLLTLQSSRFKDNSSNNFAITSTGSPRIQASSPFNPTSAYSTSNGASLYFNGSGDYLTLPNNQSQFTMGTGDFTIEMWVNVSNFSSPRTLYDTSNQGDSNPTGRFGIEITTAAVLRVFSTTGYVLTSGGTVIANTWNHIAYSRASGSGRLFINGIQVNTTYADSNNYVVGTTNRPIIGANSYDNSTGPMLGYISNLRVIKGTAVYTTDFTPPIAPLTAITNTQLLLSGNNSGITDATTKVNINTVGNAQVSTTQSKFGGSSAYFDGSGDCIKFPTSVDFSFGTGNFTIECWLYRTGAGQNDINRVFQTADGDTYTGISLCLTTAGDIVLSVSSNGSSWIINTSAAGNIPLNAWTHLAVVRNGSSFTVYVNGVSTYNASSASAVYWVSTATVVIGGQTSGRTISGYIDEFRVTKGVARYTATFTPPVIAFPRY